MLTLADSGEEVAFQDYFVRRRHDVAVSAVRFAGAEGAEPPRGAALAAAETIVIAPSNPIVSIGPLLAIDGCAPPCRPSARTSSPCPRSSAAGR